jgi:hypothetical protein
MTDTSGARAVLADAELSIVLCLFFLEVVLVVTGRFPFRNFYIDGALWPIRGFSIIGQYLIGLPLVLICGGNVSINCEKDNSTLTRSRNRYLMKNSDSKKVRNTSLMVGWYSELILAQ